MAPSVKSRVSAAVQQQQARTYLSEGELIGAAYLLTTDIMFWSGLIGAVVFRRNLIVMLLCTEIVMLACNMNFLFASAYLNDMTVRVRGMFVAPFCMGVCLPGAISAHLDSDSPHP